MQMLGSSSVRSHNASLIASLVWTEQKVSRADLSRKTGLSRSTVSAICEELMALGILVDLGIGPSNGGKPPLMIGFRDESFHLLGIDFGATHTDVLLTDLRSNVISSYSVPTPSREQPHLAIAAAKDGIKQVFSDTGIQWSSVVGIGIGVPSPVDPEKPSVLSPVVLPKWEGVPYIEALGLPSEKPVYVDNDANLGALAELWWGHGSRESSLVYIKASVGIGAGVIVNGHIIRGANSSAGEIGHVSLNPGGPLCQCGRRGCLVTLAGKQALELSYGFARGLHHSERPSLDTIFANAADGDTLALSVVMEAGRNLGIAIANLLHLLNPHEIIIGGSLAKGGELILLGVRETLETRAAWTSNLKTEVRTSKLGPFATSLGAATQVLAKALDDPSLFALSEPRSSEARRNA